MTKTVGRVSDNSLRQDLYCLLAPLDPEVLKEVCCPFNAFKVWCSTVTVLTTFNVIVAFIYFISLSIGVLMSYVEEKALQRPNFALHVHGLRTSSSMLLHL